MNHLRARPALLAVAAAALLAALAPAQDPREYAPPTGNIVLVDVTQPQIDVYLQSGYRLTDALQSWTSSHAATQAVGAPCGSRLFVQSATDLPRLGTTMTYDGDNGYPIAVTAFVMGLSTSQWNGVPLPASLAALGAEPGCFAHNDAVSVDCAVSGNTGAASFTCAIPNATNVIGFEYLTQLWSFRATSLKTSNGLRSIVGL